MLASFSCAGQYRCGLPAPDIIHSNGAIMHAHPQHVRVALGEVKTRDTCSKSHGQQVDSAASWLSLTLCALTRVTGELRPHSPALYMHNDMETGAPACKHVAKAHLLWF